MWMNNVIFEDRAIEGDLLDLSDKDSLYFLSQNLILRRCTLVINVPAKRLHVHGVQFIDCVIDVRMQLRNFRWRHAHLKGCSFKGSFLGNDFGNWPSAPGEGSIESCDFTQATLHECRFMDCDTSTMRFPPWPCFTILDPIQRQHELTALPWPADIGSYEMKIYDDEPRTMVAMTNSALDIKKRTGVPPSDLRAILETLPGVKY